MASALKIQELVSKGTLSPREGATLLAAREKLAKQQKERRKKERPLFLRVVLAIPMLILMVLWAACGGFDS